MLVGRRSDFGSARGQGGHLAADRGILNGTMQNVWATGPAWPMARRSRHEPEHVGSLDGDGLDDGRGRLGVEKGVLLRAERELPSLLRFGAPRQGGAVPGETSQVDGPLYIISRVSIGCQGQCLFQAICRSGLALQRLGLPPAQQSGANQGRLQGIFEQSKNPTCITKCFPTLAFSDSEIRCCPGRLQDPGPFLVTLRGPRDPVRRVPSESSHAASGLLHDAKVLLAPALTSFEAPRR